MDKIELDLTALKNSHKKKHEKTAAVIFSATFSGKILKPFVILNNIKTSIENGSVGFMQAVEGNEFLKWIQFSLGNWDRKRKSLRLIIAPNYSFLQKLDANKIMRANGLQVLLLPRGSSCILNPLKEVLPFFWAEVAKSAEKAAAEKKFQDNLIKWIEESVGITAAHWSQSLANAFDCFKISF